MLNDENEVKNRKVFSGRLKCLRKKANLSQQELGQKLGLSRSEILRLENQKRSPSFKTLIELANTFKVPVAIFLIPNELSELENLIKTFHKLENIEKDSDSKNT